MEDLQKKWYKNKYFLIFIAILLTAIAIRLYYFIITAHQTSWWDSCDYLSAAKAYAGIGFAHLTGQRLPGYPFFISLFFIMGIKDEVILGFLVNFIPSIIMLILLYLIISKMYPDKRIALISLAIMAVLWESLFYSNRFQTENFGMIFQFASLLCLYAFINEKKVFWLAMTGAMAMLSVFFRPGQLLFIPAVVLFLAITQWKEHKAAVISLIIAGITIFAGIMAFVPSLRYIIMSNFNASHIGPAWNSLTFFNGLLAPYLDVFFIIGIVICAILIFSKKDDSIERKSDIFNLLLIITVLFAFIFVIRAPAFEYRWFFPLITGLLVFTAKGIIDVCDGMGSLLKGNAGKVISAITIMLILGFGLAGQLSHADYIIKQKVGTYADVRSAGLWMKENTEKKDVIFSISYPQTAYYSERKVMSYAELNNSDQFDDYIMRNNPRWITVSVYEPHPQWIFEWIQKNNETIFPAAAYFSDISKQQAALVIYGFNDDHRNKIATNPNVIGENETCSEETDTCAV